MIKCGIIGYPLGHSLSPVMHKAAFDYLGIEGSYEILETPPDELVDRIKFLKRNGFAGFNVTIPLKVWITPFLSTVDDYADKAGAVNTVLIDEQKDLHGFNTDIYGFVYAMPLDIRKSLKAKKAAVYGVGGAARAVAIGLDSIGISEIVFYARDVKKGEEFKNSLQPCLSAQIIIEEHNYYADISYASLVVNTTPLGMKGSNVDISPAAMNSIISLPKDAIVYDLVYSPSETVMIKHAKSRGLQVIGGIEMLVLQGAKAFEIWTGQSAPVDVMRTAAIKTLK